MIRAILIGVTLCILSACTGGVAIGPDGKPLARLYRINDSDAGRVQFSLLDGMNSLRQVAGQQPVQLNPSLNAAAATHSRDMSIQNRAWHFGSDGSSPIDRANRAGYEGQMLGENISETYESELETLGAWMQNPDTRNVVLNPDARDIGFAWFQEENGKIWWTLIIGDGATTLENVDDVQG